MTSARQTVMIAMPRLSDSMTEGTIVSWLVSDGDTVAADQEIVEIETDKATMAYATEAAGVIRIVAASGATVAVGEAIAIVGDDDAASQPLPSASHAPAEPPSGTAAAPASPGRHVASPVARRIARENGVDLALVTGTGPRGRIGRGDVELFLQSPPPSRTSVPPAEPASADVVQEPTRAQQLIAERMIATKTTVPEFTIETEVNMGAAVDLRERLGALHPARTPSLNDLMVKAAAVALRRHPRVNSSYVDGRFHLHQQVNVGIAVAAAELLLVPTLFDADVKTLATIAVEARDLVERGREQRLTPRELEGGTFTVSNLGMFGVTAVAPILFAPQAAILGIGAVRQVLQLRDGAVVAEPMMTLTLTCDHRILYGADAAAYLAELRSLLEEPLALLQ